MNISLLDRKGIQIGLKKGWNEQDFTTKYECTPAELHDRICFLYDHGKEAEILKEIERNAKKQGGKKPRKKEAPVIMVMSVNDDEPVLNENSATTPVAEETVSEKPTLEDMVAQESELSSQMMDAEAKRFKALGERKGFADEIRKCQTEIRQILARCNKLEAQANAKGEEANNLQSEIAGLAVKLEEVRKVIAELRHITLCVYKDGTIAPYDEGRKFDLNDYGHEVLFPGLTQNKECLNLTIAEVNTLCKMFKIEQNAEGFVIEWVCDNPELERVYRVISATPETTE